MSAFVESSSSPACSSSSSSPRLQRPSSPSLCRARFLEKDPVIDEQLGFQWSVHRIPASLKHEFPLIFPGVDPSDKLLVVTYQRASVDLIECSPVVEEQKNFLLRRFVAWADYVRAYFSSTKYWVDFIDPCSGFPQYHQRGSVSHNDIDAIQQVFNYFVDSVAGCKVVSHPIWKTACYPAILYTNAPIQELENAIDVATHSL